MDIKKLLWKTVSEILAIKSKRNEARENWNKKKKTSYNFYYQTN